MSSSGFFLKKKPPSRLSPRARLLCFALKTKGNPPETSRFRDTYAEGKTTRNCLLDENQIVTSPSRSLGEAQAARLLHNLPTKIAIRLIALRQRDQDHAFCSVRIGLDEQLPRRTVKGEFKPRLRQFVKGNRPAMRHWRSLIVQHTRARLPRRWQQRRLRRNRRLLKHGSGRRRVPVPGRAKALRLNNWRRILTGLERRLGCRPRCFGNSGFRTSSGRFGRLRRRCLGLLLGWQRRSGLLGWSSRSRRGGNRPMRMYIPRPAATGRRQHSCGKANGQPDFRLRQVTGHSHRRGF